MKNCFDLVSLRINTEEGSIYQMHLKDALYKTDYKLIAKCIGNQNYGNATFKVLQGVNVGSIIHIYAPEFVTKWSITECYQIADDWRVFKI